MLWEEVGWEGCGCAVETPDQGVCEIGGKGAETPDRASVRHIQPWQVILLLPDTLNPFAHAVFL